MNKKLVKGDVVRLKSGGPEMTIAFTKKNGAVDIVASCSWFVGKMELFTRDFNVEMLELLTYSAGIWKKA